MRHPTTILGFLVVATAVTFGQKPALTHDDYDGWKSYSSVISRDGRWVALATRPQVGDGELIVRSSENDTVYRHPLGSSPQFTQDGKFVVFRIGVSREVTRAHEMKQILRRDGNGDATRHSASLRRRSGLCCGAHPARRKLLPAALSTRSISPDVRPDPLRPMTAGLGA